MKQFILLINLIITLTFCTNCNKDDNLPKKQYLFDGMPYYLTDTLFNEVTYPHKMLMRAYSIKFDSKGYAWIKDGLGCLYRYNRSTKELIGMLPAQNKDVYTQEFFIDSRDRIWITQGDMKLYMFEGTTLKTMTLDDKPSDLCEDSEGMIHMIGVSKGKEYICDGTAIKQRDLTFLNGNYHIYNMNIDSDNNIWYLIDLTPDIDTDEGMCAAKYSGENTFTIIPERQNGNSEEFSHYLFAKIIFDSKNNPYLGLPVVIGPPGDLFFTFDSENKWKIAVEAEKYIAFDSFHVDHEDNIWAVLCPNTQYPAKVVIAKDGHWINESAGIKVIKEQFSVFDISFPDENTVWICTSGGVFEFKK